MVSPSEHLSDAQLAVLATGSEDGAGTRHLAGCAACREAVAATRQAVRALAEPVELSPPPPELWGRIEAALRDEGVGATARPGTSGGAARAHRPSPGRRPWGVAVAGLLVGALAGGAGVTVASQLRDSPQGDERAVVAVGTAQLQPVAGGTMHGRAVMERESDERMELRVDVSELPGDGYLEIWLRDEDATRLISLGVLDSRSTTVQVPPGIDLARYPVVDVSREDFDGDPSHGGETLAAGAMESA